MFDCGDVLIVPIPFSDLSATKQRPVIVVTPQSYMEEANGDFIAVAVTSNPLERPHSMELIDDDLEQGRFPKPSRVRADKIFNLHQDQLKKRFGRIKKDTLVKIVRLLSQTLCRQD
jgi:mRNA interferase MazF